MRLTSADQFAISNFESLPAAAIARLPVVVALTGTSPATVWRWVRAGLLPQPVKLGTSMTGWRVGDLKAALASLGTEGA